MTGHERQAYHDVHLAARSLERMQKVAEVDMLRRGYPNQLMAPGAINKRIAELEKELWP